VLFNKVSSDYLETSNRWHWSAAYIKYAGVLVIEGKARAFEMASAHSQDEACARDFEGDMSL